MAVTLALLLIGNIGPLTGMDAAWLPLVVGILALLTTLGRCVRYGWRSDLRVLPRVGRWSGGPSRWLYRALIAWLHLIQPLARARGRVRGLSQPEAVAPQHVTRHPWKTPVPTPRDALSAARLLARSGAEQAFWSAAWTSHTTLLTELVGVLSASRPAQRVEVDEGWRPDRDLSLGIGRWGWLHIRTLVEEHEGGACLFRVRARLRPSFVGTLRGLTLAVLLAGGNGRLSGALHPSGGCRRGRGGQRRDRRTRRLAGHPRRRGARPCAEPRHYGGGSAAAAKSPGGDTRGPGARHHAVRPEGMR